MDDVEFYERQVKFQENLGKIQQERSVLEREFNNLVRSDKKFHSLRVAKLRSYSKQIYEREKKARERNEKLLRDFTEVETRLSKMHTQTNNLKQMKKRYEDEITKLYPKWRHAIDVARAKKQLEDRGFQFPDPKIQPSSASSPPATAKDSVATASTTRDPGVHLVPPQGPLFQLVPYNMQSTPAFAVNSGGTAVPAHSPLQKDVLPEQHLSKVSSRIKSPSSVIQTQSVTVPPLDLPSSAEREPSDLSGIHQNRHYTPVAAYPSGPLQSKPLHAPVNNPDPLSPTHHSTSSDVYRVEIANTETKKTGSKPEKQPGNEENSEISSSDSDVSPFSSDVSKNYDHVMPITSSNLVKSPKRSEFTIEQPATAHIDKLLTRDEPVTSPHQNSLSPKRKIIVPMPSHEAPTQDAVESILSESLTTETSHKTDVPLTSSAAYQALLKGNEISSTLGMSGYYEEDEDDMEEVLSPKPTNQRLSEDEDSLSEQDTQVKANPVHDIPTAVRSNSESATSSRNQYASNSKPAPRQTKAPWDTDSDEEDSFDSRDVGQPQKLDDDDFDFYD